MIAMTREEFGSLKRVYLRYSHYEDPKVANEVKGVLETMDQFLNDNVEMNIVGMAPIMDRCAGGTCGGGCDG